MTTSTSSSKRAHPLQANDLPTAEKIDAAVIDVATSTDRPTTAARDQRFADGVRRLRVGAGSLRVEERILMVLGGVIAPLGLVVVLLGWWGAAHSPYVFEQLPYVISGGLLGVGMIFLGSFLYFTHWLTQLVKEHRTQSVAMIEALQRLEDKVSGSQEATAPVTVNGTHPGADIALVATQRGTMAHLPDCVVVAGKSDLRSVSAADGLATCKLCGDIA